MITLYKGDDTGGQLGKDLKIHFHCDDKVDMTGVKVYFDLLGIIKEEFTNVVDGSTLSFFVSHIQSRKLPLGILFAKMWGEDSAQKIRTFSNRIPIRITNDLRAVYGSDGLDSQDIHVYSSVAWQSIANKPEYFPTKVTLVEGLEEELEKAGKVKMVNSIGPDANGNIKLDLDSLSESDGQILTTKTIMVKPSGAESYSAVALVPFVWNEIDSHNNDAQAHPAIRQNLIANYYNKTQVDNKINQFAAHYLTADAEGSAFATVAALEDADNYFYAGEVVNPTKNDYAIVLNDNGKTARWAFFGEGEEGEWQRQYYINETAFSQVQWDAINSLVARDANGNLTYDGHVIVKPNGTIDVTPDQIGALAAEDMSGTKSVRDPVVFQNAVDVAEDLTVGSKAVALKGDPAESLSDNAKLDLSVDITEENTPMNYAVMYATRNKLDGDAAAAAYATNRAYAVGEYVSYEGRVYKCTTAHSAGAWDPAHFTEERLMDPDASLVIDDVTGELKVTDAGGNVVWSSRTASMYDLVKTSSATPQANSVQLLEVTDGMTITIPTAPGGKACDFILDVHAEADATVEIANLTSVTVMVCDGVSLSADITTFAAGEYARLAFTSCAFQVDGKPTYHVTKTKVVNGVTA